MLIVNTMLSPSKIHGFGVFAAEHIYAGALVWKFTRGVDQIFDINHVRNAPAALKEYFHRYAYLDKRMQKYVVCGDDARFVNHSEYPNIVGIYPQGSEYGIDVALKDIKVGEEITCDYISFDLNFSEKLN